AGVVAAVKARRAALIALPWLAIVTVVLAFAAGVVTSNALAMRYMAVAVIPYLLLVAIGLQRAQLHRWGTAAVAGVVGLGLWSSFANVGFARTQAGQVAAALDRDARPTDLIVYCPDQLGPDVSRLVSLPVDQVTYPRMTGPSLVDWVDYREQVAETPAAAFVQRLATASAHG